jgi:hypothetical protein
VHDAAEDEVDTFVLASSFDAFLKELNTDESTDMEALAKSKKITNIKLDF